MSSASPILVGIAGGTGSGKTTVVRRILEAFDEDVICLDMDSYYRDLSEMPKEERRKFNFDHPDAFDTELFIQHLQDLSAGQAVKKPVYSFAESVRTENVVEIEPAPIVIVEGILVLADARVRDLLEVKIFVDADDDIRFIRRLERDVAERGRTLESVISQYQRTVRPMHYSFVEPSKRYADVIIPRGGKNDIAINMVVADITSRLTHIKVRNQLNLI
ncbi:uridine kinase [Bradymonadaceae bacterium TMQ3]|uniref:Uridine kinase n=1 Tax=Lujinxingia sediminis TaxID=2480984 RepID=A0ABY0CYE4_9DELT|nr:uridine kinase [Lujinxingia sediminis]RDV39046.1 uridine kinase [Bradymonadaceae bacterium TMQ3]RVU48907.1 uridine kinase [Lujinxingia sediminis]TXC78201.1 uridine kinase [Bradymonadales bacterium TMQ1]